MKAKEAVASALQTTTDAAASRNLVQSQQQQQQQLVPQLKTLASKLELTVKAVVLWMVSSCSVMRPPLLASVLVTLDAPSIIHICCFALRSIRVNSWHNLDWKVTSKLKLWLQVRHMDEEQCMVTAATNHRITIMGCSNRQQVPWKAQTLIKPCCQLCLSLHHLSRLCYTMQSDRWVWCQDHPPPVMPMKLPLLPINTFCR